jgi:molybdenum cofactor synthesis domain-containing protein
MEKRFFAAIIVIGNEILSGKTQDKNINFLANELDDIGIRLAEVSVIADDKNKIINKVKEFSSNYDYVFTTGGIGPTHDDITAESVAEAFNCKLILDDRAVKLLQQQYTPEQLNDSRMKMAYLPENSHIIHNPISFAPGFQIENVYVMAGVPNIVRGMFVSIRDGLEGGQKMLNEIIHTSLTEGMFAMQLAEVQEQNNDVEIGSYPFFHQGKVGTTLVVRSIDKTKNVKARDNILAMIAANKGQVVKIEE